VTIATFRLEVITVSPGGCLKIKWRYPLTCQCQVSEESIGGSSKKCCVLFLSCGYWSAPAPVAPILVDAWSGDELSLPRQMLLQRARDAKFRSARAMATAATDDVSKAHSSRVRCCSYGPMIKPNMSTGRVCVGAYESTTSRWMLARKYEVDNLVDCRVAASDPSDVCRQQLGDVGYCEGLFPRPFAASVVVC
jgi:hypothetical protein